MDRHGRNSEGTAAREKLEQLRDPLFELHRLILGEVRERYEREAGPVSPQQFFRLLLEAPRFQWLRPFSGLLSAIDEVLDDARATAAGYEAVLGQAGQLFRFTAEETEFSTAYKELIQTSPEIAGCHGEVRQLLPRPGSELS